MSDRRHLLVTNDFPPKLGGIQNYLWELWRRLDPTSFSVLTASSDPAAPAFDEHCAALGITVERVPGSILYFPTPSTRRLIDATARRHRADLVLLDPAFPLGSLAGRLERPAAVILHGAEVAIPGRLPGSRQLLTAALRRSAGVIAAGPYPEAEALRAAGGRLPPVLQLPPGVDCHRFVPLSTDDRLAVRRRFGLSEEAPLVVSVSRLVPRKGMDTLIKASARATGRLGGLEVAIAGSGRDRGRLDRLLASSSAPVRMLGRVPDEELPALLGAADLFVMACRSRWAGLEQEGFGIVFVEAAAAGVPQIAGRSGGSADAVVDGETGLILERSSDADQLARMLCDLLLHPERARAMGAAGRRRALASFDYDVLARRLGEALEAGWPSEQRESTSNLDEEGPR